MSEKLNSAGRGLKRGWRLVAVAAILALALGAVSTSGVRAAQPSVPFTFSVSGMLTPSPGGTLSLAGNGDASHLGNVKSYQAIVTLADGNSVGNPTVSDTLTETLTAANGDTLTLSCVQTATLSSGVYHGIDQWTVMGGTGRFSGATGSGTGDTYVTLANKTFTKQGTGSISY